MKAQVSVESVSARQLMQELLHQVWPGVQQLKWSIYGNNILTIDEQGLPKYTGLLMYYSSSQPLVVSLEPCGFLIRPEESTQHIVRSADILGSDPGILSSMEKQQNLMHDLACCVRCSDHSQSYAMIGLPHICNQTLINQMMLQVNLLVVDDWEHVLDPTANHMDLAMKYAGMNSNQYAQLKMDIQYIVTAAYDQLYRTPESG